MAKMKALNAVVASDRLGEQRNEASAALPS